MDVAHTRAVLDSYLAALVAREDIAPYFADDVVLSLVEIGQEIAGRDAVAGAIVALHQQTFDARPEVVNLVVSEGGRPASSSSLARTPASSPAFRRPARRCVCPTPSSTTGRTSGSRR